MHEAPRTPENDTEEAAPAPWKKVRFGDPASDAAPPWKEVKDHVLYGAPRSSKKPLTEARHQRQSEIQASHEAEKGRIRLEVPICKHWLAKQCKRGHDCRFAHPSRSPPPTTNTEKIPWYESTEDLHDQWSCRKCGLENFAHKTECYNRRCRNPRPEELTLNNLRHEIPKVLIEWVQQQDPSATLPSPTSWDDKPSQESTYEVDPSQEWHRGKRDDCRQSMKKAARSSR